MLWPAVLPELFQFPQRVSTKEVRPDLRRANTTYFDMTAYKNTVRGYLRERKRAHLAGVTDAKSRWGGRGTRKQCVYLTHSRTWRLSGSSLEQPSAVWHAHICTLQIWKAPIPPPVCGGGQQRVTDWSGPPVKLQRHFSGGGLCVIDSMFSMTRRGEPREQGCEVNPIQTPHTDSLHSPF